VRRGAAGHPEHCGEHGQQHQAARQHGPASRLQHAVKAVRRPRSIEEDTHCDHADSG
jgi:hypothetical protein